MSDQAKLAAIIRMSGIRVKGHDVKSARFFGNFGAF